MSQRLIERNQANNLAGQAGGVIKAAFVNNSALSGGQQFAVAANPGQFSMNVDGRLVAIRTVRVTNRAEKGYVKAWFAHWNGNVYPSDSKFSDKASWLQPGESMELPVHVAIFCLGDFSNPDVPESRQRYADKIGGFHTKFQDKRMRTFLENVAAEIVGPPIFAPDLLVEVLDDRGRPIVDKISTFEHFFGEDAEYMYGPLTDEEKEIEAKEIARRFKTYAP